MNERRMIQLASIAAMKGILSNPDEVRYAIDCSGDLIQARPDHIANYAIACAEALARKWEEME